jgi:hypothetical protein
VSDRDVIGTPSIFKVIRSTHLSENIDNLRLKMGGERHVTVVGKEIGLGGLFFIVITIFSNFVNINLI